MSEPEKQVGNHKKIKLYPKNSSWKGSFGEVFSGTYNFICVAVKRMTLAEKKESRSKNFESELKIIKESNHRNIVKYLFDDEDENFSYIVMEMCRCSLKDFFDLDFKKDYTILGQPITQLKIMFQATTGLAYLHDNRIIHRDIKMSNILLHQNRFEITIKIADFGLSRILDADRTSVTTKSAGTKGYQACEILQGKNPKFTSDVFSLGIVFHEILEKGKHPFSENALEKDYFIMMEKKPTVVIVDDVLNKMVTDMIDHSDRPTSETVREIIIRKYANQQILTSTTLESPLHSNDFGWTVDENTTSENKDEKESTSRYDNGAQELYTQHSENAVTQPLSAFPIKRHNQQSAQDQAKKKFKRQDDGKNIRRTKKNLKNALKAYSIKKGKICDTNTGMKSSRLDVLLKMAELKAYEGKWDDARTALNDGLSQLRNLSDIGPTFFQEEATECITDLRAIVFLVCAAVQHRALSTSKDAAFNTGKCVYNIHDSLKKMMKCEPRDEMRGGTQYKDIGLKFVCPVMVEILRKQLDDISNVLPLPKAKNKAYASSWIAVTYITLDCHERANTHAEEASLALEKVLSKDECMKLQSYARLLSCRGEASIHLEKFEEAEKLIKKAIQSQKKATDYGSEEDRNAAIRFTKQLLLNIPKKYVTFQND